MKKYLLLICLILCIGFVSASSIQVLQGQHFIGTTFQTGVAEFNHTVYDNETNGEVCFSKIHNMTRGDFGQWYCEVNISASCNNSSKDYWIEIRIDGVLQEINPDGDTRRRLTMFDYLRRDTSDISTGAIDAESFGATQPIQAIKFSDANGVIRTTLSQSSFTFGNLTRSGLAFDKEHAIISNYPNGLIAGNAINLNDSEFANTNHCISNFDNTALCTYKFNKNYENPNLGIILNDGNGELWIAQQQNNSVKAPIKIGFYNGYDEVGEFSIYRITNFTPVMIINKTSNSTYLTTNNYDLEVKGNLDVSGVMTGTLNLGYQEENITSGNVTYYSFYMGVLGEGGINDDLDNIIGGFEGDVVNIFPLDGNSDIKLRHGTGNLDLNGVDCNMKSLGSKAELRKVNGNWKLITCIV